MCDKSAMLDFIRNGGFDEVNKLGEKAPRTNLHYLNCHKQKSPSGIPDGLLNKGWWFL